MNISKHLVLSLLVILNCSCDAFYKELPNRYYLHPLEGMEQLNLGRITDTINDWGEGIVSNRVIFCAMDDSMFYVIQRNLSNTKLLIGETYYYTLPIYGKDSIFDYLMPCEKSVFESRLNSANKPKLEVLFNDYNADNQ